MAPVSAQAQEFFNRYEQLKAIEQTKNLLIEVSIIFSRILAKKLPNSSINSVYYVVNSNSAVLQDLLSRITELEDAYQRERLDHDRETRFNREVQMHEMELMEQLTRFKTAMVYLSVSLCVLNPKLIDRSQKDQEPFVIALLDGDGMIFRDSLVQQGEKGGKDAANQLWLAIRDYTSETFTNIHSPKIVARIYANVRGLGETLFKAGIIDKPSVFEDFVRGFNGGRLLFDFVDVGSGKDRADDKLAELTRRITLLEGFPFERELASLISSYRVTKFETLFRESKITPLSNHTWENAVTSTSYSSSNIGHPNPRAVSRTPSNSNGTAATTSAASATSGSSSTTPATWASTIAASASTTFKDLTPSKPSTPSPPVIERNKYGQRVDRIDFKAAPKDELNRVKKLKLCNLFFLLGDCPNPNCYHTHDYKLGKQERMVLQVVARMTPCHFGTECDDATCIYGHRCPLSEAGKKDCYWGSNCRFDADAHGIDTNIVKLTKV
ncbi:CCCH zinc finger DNA binding protein [Trichophyton verrucosum HKI 0517]|uniref:CCCH zinc finger DNA binding protein n=1 Tax=Trichophyton verrucosum (strain HKI 0517) TaxID=663202 RepID=D4D9W5_TRIVH|nr:CCCH zinc finger DNA binding protein [Trichophyton verrucosum HKI 0517]EFE41342.1 CCCH zinc finger DNA binding protein [Trichophyton verrucosum HKI 0517]